MGEDLYYQEGACHCPSVQVPERAQLLLSFTVTNSPALAGTADFPRPHCFRIHVRTQKREGHLPSQKRSAHLSCEWNTARHTLEFPCISPLMLTSTNCEVSLWETVWSEVSWPSVLLITYPALSLCFSWNSPRNFDFLLYVLLLNTQYLREPWALPACYLTKEGEGTFTERMRKYSVQTSTLGNVKDETTLGHQPLVHHFPLYPTLFWCFPI